MNEPLPPGTEPYDCDGDRYAGDTEQYIFSAVGTANDQKRCGVDAWPPDINNSGFSDISDIVFLTNSFGQAIPPAPVRYDIAPNGFVDITDISRMTAFFGQHCS